MHGNIVLMWLDDQEQMDGAASSVVGHTVHSVEPLILICKRKVRECHYY